MTTTYTYYQDPGHGWIEVPLGELSRLGIASKISSYSYIKGGYAYLEEDCDASLFMHYKKDRGEEVKLVEVYQEHTPIRNYRSYQA